MGFCDHCLSVVDKNWPLSRDYWQLGRILVAVALWRGGRCREFKLRVRQKSRRCKDVAISGGWTVPT